MIAIVIGTKASIFSINLSFVGIFRSFILKTLSISIFRSFSSILEFTDKFSLSAAFVLYSGLD